MSLVRDLEFIYEIGCLRHISRTWKQFFNADFANLAEHSLRVIWLALIIAKNEKVKNTEKIIKMALVHDLAESRGVDVHYISRQFVIRKEEAAMNDILNQVSIADEMKKLWQEYEKRDSLEAKIVKDADNLDVDLELREQAIRGYQLKEWRTMRKKVAATQLYTQTAKKLWQKIQTSNPHDWHLHATNRFNSGDWSK